MSRVLVWTLPFAAVLAAVFHAALYQHVNLDDPYILFRYARHLLQGHGLLWNPGEAPVEGYTEPLWLLVAFVGLWAADDPFFATRFAGALLSALLVGWFTSPFNRLVTTLGGRLLVGLLIVGNVLWAFYAVSGMGHILFGALLAAAAYCYSNTLMSEHRAWRIATGLVLGVAAIARPEGIGFFLATVAFDVGRSLATRSPRSVLPNLVALAVPFVVLYAPYFLWRFDRYGWLFPNTYYAKHTGGFFLTNAVLGVQYVAEGWSEYFAIPLVFALTIAFARWVWTKQRPAWSDAYLLYVIAVVAGYVVYVGGDDASAFPSTRLLVPAVPLAALVAARALEQLGLTARTMAAVAAVVAFSTVAAEVPAAMRLFKKANEDFSYRQTPADVLAHILTPRPPRADPRFVTFAGWLHKTAGGDCLAAFPFVGELGYRTSCRVIDTLGLNDTHIAHLPKRQRGVDVKGDPDYVIGRRPDVIVVAVDRKYLLDGVSFEAAGGWKEVDREMIDKLRAHPDYELRADAPFEYIVFARRGLRQGR